MVDTTFDPSTSNPRTGRLVKEDGTTINEADLIDGGDGITVAPKGKTGISMMIGPFGEVLVGYKRDDISIDWQYDFLNTQFDNKPAVLTGDGAATVTNSKLQVSSAVTGTATVESRDTIRYIPGHSGFADFTFRCTGSTGLGRAGAADDEDGFFVQYENATSTWKFGYRRDGTDTTVTFTDASMDANSLRIFRIWFGYLGVASPLLQSKGLDETDLDFRTVAVIDTENDNGGDTHVLRPEFPMFVYAENGATVQTASWNGGTIGNGDSDRGSRSFTFPNTPLVNGTALEQGTMTLTSTNVGTVVILNLKSTYKSKTNKVKARLLRWQSTVIPPASGDGEVLLQIIALPTLSGTPTYADIDTDNSTIEYDHTANTGASVSYSSGGRMLLQQEVFYVAGQGSSSPTTTLSVDDAERLGLIGYPGDYFVVIAKDRDGNGVTVRTELVWEELF